jgi:uncharacterized membrane protein YdjX (TVP38/TMEM64 family)
LQPGISVALKEGEVSVCTLCLFFRKHLLQMILACVGVFLLWLFRTHLLAFAAWVGNHQAVTETIHRLGAWGPLALFALLVLQVFVAIIPGHALILAGGYVYGFGLSLLITLSSTVLGSQIAFLLARRYGRRLIYRLASRQVIERWDRLAANQGALFYFFAFVLPIFPSDLMCYVAGLGTISPRRFLMANIPGRLVCAAFITLVGSNGLQMPPIFWVAVILAVAGLYLAWLVYSRGSKINIHRSIAAQKGA